MSLYSKYACAVKYTTYTPVVYVYECVCSVYTVQSSKTEYTYTHYTQQSY